MSNQGSAVTTVNGRSVTQTVVSVDSTGVLLSAAATGRTYFGLMNISTVRATLGFDAIPTAGSGWALAPAAGAGDQGGTQTWEGTAVPTNAIYARTASGTASIVVLEGIGG